MASQSLKHVDSLCHLFSRSRSPTRYANRVGKSNKNCFDSQRWPLPSFKSTMRTLCAGVASMFNKKNRYWLLFPRLSKCYYCASSVSLFFFLSCDDGDIVAASTVHTCRSVCPKVQFPFDFRPSVHARVGASRFLFLEREREEKKSGMATGLYKASQAKTWPLSPSFVIV